jgi:hypothetical protein
MISYWNQRVIEFLEYRLLWTAHCNTYHTGLVRCDGSQQSGTAGTMVISTYTRLCWN